MNTHHKISVTDFALIIAIAYINHLTILNGDNKYVGCRGEIELEPRILAHFFEEYYKEDFNEMGRLELYLMMINKNQDRLKCQFNIGITWNLTPYGIKTLNDLMDDYIEMMLEQSPDSIMYQ